MLSGDKLKLRIEEILAFHDLQALIKIGAPSDEYSPEAEPMAEWLEVHPTATLEEIKTELHSIFADMFTPKMADYPDYTAAASDIYRLVHSEEPPIS